MPAKKNKQPGVTVRGIAREWGVSPAYVSRFLGRLGVRPLAGGGYDFEQATKMREQNTIIGRGRAKWDRHHPSEEIHTCVQCGALYTPAGALRDGFAAQDTTRYCLPECQGDADRGVSPEETVGRLRKEHLDNGGSRSDFKNPDRWLNFHTHYRSE